jgi:hypothetical protein
LLELVDFKVSLTTPYQNMIPAFYLRDKESLDAYFDRVFVSERSLFGGPLTESGQLDAVLNHVVGAVTGGDRRFNTRRAILVVP